MCAKADDPLTTQQYDKAIRVTTSNSNAAEAMSGNYYITFAGQRSSAFDADGTAMTNTTCSAAWETMENIRSARCFQVHYDATTLAGEYVVALVFDNYGQNNVHYFETDPDVSLFTCDMSEVEDAITGTPGCAITDDVDLTVRHWRMGIVVSVGGPDRVPYPDDLPRLISRACQTHQLATPTMSSGSPMTRRLQTNSVSPSTVSPLRKSTSTRSCNHRT